MERSQSTPFCFTVDTRTSLVPSHKASAGLPSSFNGDRGHRPSSSSIAIRSIRDASKGRNRTRKIRQGVLFPSFHGPKKGRGKKTSDKLKASKQVRFHSDLSDGLGSHSCQDTSTGRLGNLVGPERRFFPYSHTSEASALPQIYLEGTGLPISLNSIRPVYSSLHLHQSNPASHAVVQGAGHKGNLLPGRYPFARDFPSSVPLPNKICTTQTRGSGIHNQFEEVGLGPFPGLFIPRPRLELPHHGGFASTRQDRGVTVQCPEAAECGPSYIQVHSAVSGQGQLRMHSCPQGQTTLSASATPFAKGPRQSFQEGHSNSRGQGGPQVVGGPQALCGAPLLPGTVCDTHHRCVIPGLGGLTRQEIDQGPMATELAQRSSQTHQRTGDACSFTCGNPLGSSDVRKDCTIASGQFLHSPLHKEGGGDQIRSPVQTSYRDPRHLLQSPHPIDPQPPAGSGKHSVRRTISPEVTGRVASQHRGGEKDFQPIGSTAGRPVCFETHSAGSQILLPRQEGQTGLGHRRLGSPVGLQGNVCLSPTGDAPAYRPEVPPPWRQANPDSTILDRGPLVSRGVLHAIQTPHETEVQEEPDNQRCNRSPPNLPQPPPPDGVAAFKAAVTATGTSEEVAQFLSASWRGSTSVQYRSVWRSWVAWCQSTGLDTTSISVNKLLDYLLFLHQTRRLSWSTVGVHRSAISSMLMPLAIPPLGEHPLVTRFMRALFLKRPPSTEPRWSWDMASVLGYVRDLGQPSDLTLRQLVAKLAFLIAVFSARRVADLPLLRISPKYLQRTASAAVFQPAFGAKQDRPGHQNPVIVLRAYADNRLCPIATLDEYLSRTNYANRDEALFLTSTSPFHPAAKATIKRWILLILQAAGVQASPGSTRAAAASFALARNISLQAVMTSADWSRTTTVFRHYVRLLPREVLAHIAQSTSGNVQAAVLDTL